MRIPKSLGPLTLVSLLLVLAWPSSGRAITFAALGDSLTDEYVGRATPFGATDLPALSWVQILAEKRGLDFGAFQADPGVRGEPRNEGYEHNWARSGAVAAPPGIFSIPTLSTQVAGLTPSVAAGLIDVVYLGIGSNDFAVREIQKGNLGEPFIGADFDAWRDERLDAVFDAIDLLIDGATTAGKPVDIVLSVLPPGTAVGQDPTVVGAIGLYNDALTARASTYGIETVDLWRWTGDPGRVDEDGALVIGPYLVPEDSTANIGQTTGRGAPGAGPCDSQDRCATLDYALNFIASDGIHPNTIVQGLLANEFIGVINARHGLDIAPLTDLEILEAAAPIPEPGTGLLLGAGLAGFAAHARRRHTASRDRASA